MKPTNEKPAIKGAKPMAKGAGKKGVMPPKSMVPAKSAMPMAFGKKAAKK